MVTQVYEKYVERYLRRVSEFYDIEYNILQYYWRSLENGCQHVYVQGDKKGCRCGGKIRKVGDMYCRIHQHKKINVILHKNKVLDKWWHAKTGLVFDNNKTVIGYYKEGEMFELDDSKIELCRKYKFKIRYKNC